MSLWLYLAMEGAIGTGDYTAYQLVSNRHHELAVRPNTGYVRAAVEGSAPLGEAGHWLLSGCVDVMGSVHADHSLYLQQCYLNLAWKGFYVEAGSRQRDPVLRHAALSSGSLITSGNAKPVPQVRVGTNAFWSVPGTGGWLDVLADASYGMLVDDDWHLGRYDGYLAQQHNSYVTTDVLYHQKRLYLRTDTRRTFSFTLGVEHAVQFGGTKDSYETGQYTLTQCPPRWTDFLKVLVPQSDGSAKTNAADSFVLGNHLGEWSVNLAWNIRPGHTLSAYLENMFEDGSGIHKGNRWDGLWGLQYDCQGSGVRPVRSVVVEYLHTLDQSGPIHWAPDDFGSAIGSQLPGHAIGNDNYYNNYYYNGYAHYGMSMGTPLLMSPIYNRDGYLNFTDTRVRAWHAGVTGDLSPRADYLIRGSYRQGYGTYFVPLAERHHSLDVMAQCRYRLGAWSYAVAVALTRGNIYGDCSTFDFKVSYHGKLL